MVQIMIRLITLGKMAILMVHNKIGVGHALLNSIVSLCYNTTSQNQINKVTREFQNH